MGHLRKWLKYQQYLPKQLQIPHSTSARSCIYYLGHGTRPSEPADTEGWEQGWGACAVGGWVMPAPHLCPELPKPGWGPTGSSCSSLGAGRRWIATYTFCWRVNLGIGIFAGFFSKTTTNFSAQEWKCPEITWRKGAWSFHDIEQYSGTGLLKKISFLSRLGNLYRLSCAFVNIVKIQCVSHKAGGSYLREGCFPKEKWKEDLFLLRRILAIWIGFIAVEHNFPYVQGSSSGWMWAKAKQWNCCSSCLSHLCSHCSADWWQVSKRMHIEWETAAACRDWPCKPILLRSHVSFIRLLSLLLITMQIVALAAPQRQLFHEDEEFFESCLNMKLPWALYSVFLQKWVSIYCK